MADLVCENTPAEVQQGQWHRAEDSDDRRVTGMAGPDLFRASKTSLGARFSSSSMTQWPCLMAVSNAPSWNVKCPVVSVT